MPTPKFRLFAGPNADKIEAELGKKRKFYFNSYRVRTNEEEFKSDVLHSGLLMSHPSKLEFLQIARKEGYKTYLYFVFTDDLNTNLARAQLRVSDGGHAVSAEHTLARAPRTFKLSEKRPNR